MGWSWSLFFCSSITGRFLRHGLEAARSDDGEPLVRDKARSPVITPSSPAGACYVGNATILSER
eukprot:7741007-Alexandrium_andersonii.AAC.1